MRAEMGGLQFPTQSAQVTMLCLSILNLGGRVDECKEDWIYCHL